MIRSRRRFVPALLIVVGLVVFFALRLDRLVSFDALLTSRDALRGLVADNPIQTLGGFVLLYVAATALSVPGASILTLASGFMFGTILGGCVAAAGAALGASALFLAARSFLCGIVASMKNDRLRNIAAGFRDSATSYMLFLRLTPIFPFWLVNLAAASANVPFRTFAWTTLVGILPLTFAITFAGASLDALAATAENMRNACIADGSQNCHAHLTLWSLLSPRLGIALLVLAAATLIPVIIKKSRSSAVSAHGEAR